MNQHDREIDDLVAELWREKHRESPAAGQIRSRVLANPLESAIVAGRALSVIKSINQSPAWAARVEEFSVATARLIQRCHQIDKLGDPNTDPAAVFEILAMSLPEGSVRSLTGHDHCKPFPGARLYRSRDSAFAPRSPLTASLNRPPRSGRPPAGRKMDA